MYQVKVLTNKEFDKVAKSSPRYKHVDDDNLGFADPIEKTAYVRHTAFPELNKYLIEHEFEHLLEEKGTDEDDMGIRHKKKSGFANLLQKFYNPINIPGLGPLSNSDKGVFNTDNQSSTRGQNQVNPAEVAQQYQNSFGTTGAQFGNLGGTPQASPNAPSGNPQDSIGSGLYNSNGFNSNQQQAQIDPELQKRISGFFSGRIPF